MKPFLRLSSQKGATLVELFLSIGITGVIMVMGSTLMVNFQNHIQLNTREIGALDESLIFLNRLQKANSVELIDEKSPSNQRFLSKKLENSFDGFGAGGLYLTASSLNKDGRRIDMYTIENKCKKVSRDKYLFYPRFKKEYVKKIFDQYAKKQGQTSFAFSRTKCMDFLEDRSSGSSVFFECGENEVPYAQLRTKDANGKDRHSPVKIPANIDGGFSLRSFSPVAAFFCQSVADAGDDTKLMDVSIWSAITDTRQTKNPDKSKRLKWFLQRIVLSPPSSSENVQYFIP